MPPPSLGNKGPKLIHQSPIQTMFIQLCLAAQLFTLADVSSKKGKKKRAIARHKNRLSLHRALVLAFGGVGDCLGIPLGGINYTSSLKGLSLVFTGICEASKVPRYLALFLFMFLHQTFFLLKLSRTHCQSGNVGHLRCYCKT